MTTKKKPTDWRKRFEDAKPPKTVTLHTDFAGIKSGTVMYIGSPAAIARYIAHIPRGEMRTIERMRNELARKNKAQATCPVTTAIFLRVVAETALADLRDGQTIDNVVPFWRVVTPGSKIAVKLGCDAEFFQHLQSMDTAPAVLPQSVSDLAQSQA